MTTSKTTVLGSRLFLGVLTILILGLAVFSESSEEYAVVWRLMNRILGLAGSVLFVYVGVSLVIRFDEGHTLRALALHELQ